MIFGSVRVAIILDVSFKDFTFTGKTLHIITTAEAAVSIMVASSPMLRPIFDRLWRTSISTLRYGDDSTKYKLSHSANTSKSSNTLTTGTLRSSLKSKAQGFTVIQDDIALTPVPVNQHVTRIDANSTPSTV
jgi:hypothetical protein